MKSRGDVVASSAFWLQLEARTFAQETLEFVLMELPSTCVVPTLSLLTSERALLPSPSSAFQG